MMKLETVPRPRGLEVVGETATCVVLLVTAGRRLTDERRRRQSNAGTCARRD